jgi:2-iminoacetate synthase ThiH
MALAAHLDTLAPVREKILAGERLDFDDGVALLESEDLLALGELAGCGAGRTRSTSSTTST